MTQERVTKQLSACLSVVTGNHIQTHGQDYPVLMATRLCTEYLAICSIKDSGLSRCSRMKMVHKKLLHVLLQPWFLMGDVTEDVRVFSRFFVASKAYKEKLCGEGWAGTVHHLIYTTVDSSGNTSMQLGLLSDATFICHSNTRDMHMPVAVLSEVVDAK